MTEDSAPPDEDPAISVMLTRRSVELDREGNHADAALMRIAAMTIQGLANINMERLMSLVDASGRD